MSEAIAHGWAAGANGSQYRDKGPRTPQLSKPVESQIQGVLLSLMGILPARGADMHCRPLQAFSAVREGGLAR